MAQFSIPGSTLWNQALSTTNKPAAPKKTASAPAPTKPFSVATAGTGAPQPAPQPSLQQQYPATTGNGGGDSGSSGPTYTDTSAARGATQSAIDSLGTVLTNTLGGISARYQQLMGRYADEETTNKTAYEEQVTGNEQTRSRNVQSSLLAAAQGGRGLRSVLASMGALGGTGSLLARRAVASEANKDIGEGDRTFDGNAKQLQTAYAATQQDEKNRKAEAESAKVNEENAAKSSVAKERQSLYSSMADLWKDNGNIGEATKFLGMAGSLSPEIAGYTATSTPAYTPRSVVYNPGQLKSYLAGRNDMTVKVKDTTGPNSALNSPISALSSRRREELV